MFSWWLKTFSLINFYSLKTNKINYSNPYFPSCYDWKLQFSQAVHCTRTGRVHIHHRCQIHKYINNLDSIKWYISWIIFWKWQKLLTRCRHFHTVGPRLYWIFYWWWIWDFTMNKKYNIFFLTIFIILTSQVLENDCSHLIFKKLKG